MTSSKSKIDERFSDRVQDLQTYAEKRAKGLQNQEAPEWAISSIRGLESADLTDPEGLSDEVFGRDKLDEQFDEVTGDAQNPGTTGDLVVIQTQGDILAMVERAFRSRYMSPFCRSLAHAAARADAAGDQSGGTIRRATTDIIEDFLKRAGQ